MKVLALFIQEDDSDEIIKLNRDSQQEYEPAIERTGRTPSAGLADFGLPKWANRNRNAYY